MYWRLISRVRMQVGRRPTPKDVRELIFQMVAENPTWGAPRIHRELLMLGFDLAERTISRWMKRAPRDRDRTAAGTSNPYFASRSKSRNLGADSNGNASRSC
jgi:hypothetical protein